MNGGAPRGACGVICDDDGKDASNAARPARTLPSGESAATAGLGGLRIIQRNLRTGMVIGLGDGRGNCEAKASEQATAKVADRR